jgi:hypothetical protein
MPTNHNKNALRLVRRTLNQNDTAYGWLSVQGYGETAAEQRAETRKALRNYLTEPPATLKPNAELLRDELAAYAAKNLTDTSTRLKLAQLTINEIDREELVRTIANGDLYQKVI